MKRKLLNIFSKLFTGMKIQSAQYDHWISISGAGNMLHSIGAGAGGKKEERQDHALIEMH
jgi:hypothetical protein